MNVLLLEDEKRFIDHYSDLVKETLENVRVFKAMNGDSALRIIESEAIDLMIFDMELDEKRDMLGLDYASVVASGDDSVDFMIISGYSSYFEDSTSVQPYYYFMKPLDEDFFRRKLLEWEVVRKSSKSSGANSIKIKTKSGLSIISINNIIYLEKVNRNVVIKTSGKEYTTKIALKEIKKLLDERFFETHQSFVVNVEAVSDIRIKENRSCEILFTDVDEIALMSRYKSKMFVKRFDELKLLRNQQ